MHGCWEERERESSDCLFFSCFCPLTLALVSVGVFYFHNFPSRVFILFNLLFIYVIIILFK